MRRRCLLTSLLAGLLATSAWAGDDGVIEINAVSAAAGNAATGDAPGFPVTIQASGSYRLTSNLDGGGTTAALIEIYAARTSVDLNGFSLANAFRGIYGVASDVAVHDGSIHGMTGEGIFINGSGYRLERLRVLGNAHGISVFGDGVSVLDSIVIGNSGAGISLAGGTVRGCVVTNNGTGVLGYLLAMGNPPALAVEGNALISNQTGVSALNGAIVENLFAGNTLRGLQVFAVGTAQSATGVGRNAFVGNGGIGGWQGPGVQTAPNVCNGAVCP